MAYVVMSETFNGNINDPHYASHTIAPLIVVGDAYTANDYVLDYAIEEWEADFYDYNIWKYRADKFSPMCGIITLEDEKGCWTKVWCDFVAEG